MKVALFSDIVTWVATGEIPDSDPAPDVIADGSTAYTNLALQGGTYLLLTHPELKAAYVISDNDDLSPTAVLTDIKKLDKPVSTEGA